MSICERIDDQQQVRELLAKHCQTNADGCWVWLRSKRGKGSAQLTLSGRRQVYGHRAAYEAFIGEIPSGLMVCHKCDNPACCNPWHMFIGTAKDNTRDCVAKGRLRPGRVGGLKKLADWQYEAIRKLREDGMLQRQIGAVFGVSQARVSQILRGAQCQ